MIKRVPLKRDPPGQCGRWRVIVYNKETKKYDWHTIRGTRADAKALERKFEDAKRKGEYTGPLERRTFEEVANLFLDDRRANNRRMSTLEEISDGVEDPPLAPAQRKAAAARTA